MNVNTEIMFSQPWINGKEEATNEHFDVFNPATGRLIRKVGESEERYILKAIDCASNRFVYWRSTPASKRAYAIEQWANEIESHANDLAKILSSENGKPISEAIDEIQHSVDALRWCARSAERLCGETLPNPNMFQKNYTLKQPVGVVACITPWNFPAASVLVKVGAAIASGCTVIVKPSEETPLIALALAALSHNAKLPPGVLNVLPTNDPNRFGNILSIHPEIKMISFTGSTDVGKKLFSSCGPSLKRIALELGGNAPFIVFQDADINKAVDDAINARFYNSGQICVGANRFFIHEAIYKEFAGSLAKKVHDLKVGNPMDNDTNIGPMINQKSKDRILGLINDAISKGAELVTKTNDTFDNNLYLNPAVLIHMSKDMHAYDEELFGPVACLYSFNSERDVMTYANDTYSGLAAYVYSADVARLIRVSENLEAGVIGANSTQIFSNNLPFGGIKQSGIGREHGINSLEEYVQTKSVCLNINSREPS